MMETENIREPKPLKLESDTPLDGDQAEAEAAPEPPGAVKEAVPEDELEALKAGLEQERNKRLRLLADYDNFRRRMQAEFRQMALAAGERVIKLLLPVLDDFERLVNHQPSAADLDGLKQGIQLIYRRINAVLKAEGLEPIEALGKPFDPEIHEAVTQVEDPSQPAGTVMVETQKGYRLSGRIIRHARVVVNRAPETKTDADADVESGTDVKSEAKEE